MIERHFAGAAGRWHRWCLVSMATCCLAAAAAQDGTGPESTPPAAELSGLETPTDLDGRIEAARAALSELSNGRAEDDPEVGRARRLVEALEARRDAETRTREYESRLAAADSDREAIARRLASANAMTPDKADPTLDLDAVKGRIADLQARLAMATDEVDAVSRAIETRQTRRIELREESASVAEALARAEAGTADTIDNRDARIQRRRAEVRALETERRNYDATDDILRDRQRAAAKEREILTASLDSWKDRGSTLEAEALAARRRDAAATARAESNPITAAAAARNTDLADRLVAISRDDSVSATLAARTDTLDELRRSLEGDRRRFTGRVSPAIAAVIRHRHEALPSEVVVRQEMASNRATIEALELERLLLVEDILRLARPASEAARLVDEASPPVPDSERSEIESRLATLLQTRLVDYAEPLLTALERRLDEFSVLQKTDESLLNEITAYRAYILEQTLWVRDTSATESGLWTRIRRQASAFVNPNGWRRAGDLLSSSIRNRPWLLAIGLLPGLFLIMFRNAIATRSALASERIARAATDRFRETLVVAGFAVVHGLALAAPIMMIAFALSSEPGASRITLALDQSLGELGIFIFAIGFLSATLRRGGLAEKHFHWHTGTVSAGRHLVAFAWVASIFAIGERLCGQTQLDLPDLGRVLFTPIPLIIGCYFAWLAWRGRRGAANTPESGKGPAGRSAATRIALTVLIVVPIVAAALANLGWFDAASLIQRSIVRSLMLVAGLLVLRALFFRGLHAHQRQASWTLRRQREEGVDTASEVEALTNIGTRTRNAILFCVITLLCVGLWMIWRGLLPAFHRFESIELWTYWGMQETDVDGEASEAPALVPVTLGSLVLALGTVGATLYSARNLPTLVEVLILDRFDLERGVKYAASQLIQWVVVISGIAFAFSLVGVTWQSVQWLAAGFTVGLGFGLQEIFANFISGIIILFEQPIRVGDVVTVGTTTGKISRVRMRSTTITDWDRKELIVPNKQFITTEVVNWSIGESCIRLVLPVGASYRDDPEQVAAILQRLGEEEPLTLSDPPPSVHFAGFGDSSLNFELRVFLSGTDHLIEVRNRLNIAIKRAFEEGGVTIPFPQRDVHVAMVRRDDPDSGPAATIPLPSGDDGSDS